MSDERGRSRADGFAASELLTGYDPAHAAATHAQMSEHKKMLYRREKMMGVRLPDGSKPLKNLGARHQRIIALYLMGKFSGMEIAEHIGCSAATVYRTINDPKSKQLIDRYHSGVQMDLKALLPLAVDAVREGLTNKDPDVRLRAVDRYNKMTQVPEDGVAAGVNITFIQETRERFFSNLREVAGETIEGVVVEDPPAPARLVPGPRLHYDPNDDSNGED